MGIRPIDANGLYDTVSDNAAHRVISIEDVLGFIESAATLDYAPVRQGCEYCSGKCVEYQHTIHTKLYVNTYGIARTLETECNYCPPYAQCSIKGITACSAFPINYCPNCGAKLET